MTPWSEMLDISLTHLFSFSFVVAFFSLGFLSLFSYGFFSPSSFSPRALFPLDHCLVGPLLVGAL